MQSPDDDGVRGLGDEKDDFLDTLRHSQESCMGDFARECCFCFVRAL
ncbi:MAG: hypothetical protein P1V97_17645 [Planctomycetota bacterium]|nr:hypothetical protein [Planctomycetota bacterium]